MVQQQAEANLQSQLSLQRESHQQETQDAVRGSQAKRQELMGAIESAASSGVLVPPQGDSLAGFAARG